MTKSFVSLGCSDATIRLGPCDEEFIKATNWTKYSDKEDASCLCHAVNEEETMVGGVDAIGACRVYDIETTKRIRYSNCHECEVWCCCFSADSMFFTASDDASFKGFDLRIS